MKLRPRTLVASTLAVLSIGIVAPAHAQASDPAQLSATIVQTPGAHDGWTVSASWPATPDVTSYQVTIADAATAGTVYEGPKDVKGTTVSFPATALAEDEVYWVVVQPKPIGVGAAQTVAIHTPVLDTTAPGGAYRLDRTSATLSSGFATDDVVAEVAITETAGEAGATRTVLADDGTAAKPWASGSTFILRYTKAGTYHPSVQVVDAFGNSRVVELGPVTIAVDETVPTIHIATPARPGRVASWRRIRGTASDTGTGLALVGAFVMEKRGSTWWTYDFKKRTWLKGYTSRRKSEAKSKASPVLMPPPASGAWRTPAIKGLTAGTLYVEAAAFDGELNIGLATTTRRIR